jgi:hypothetical protein
MSEKLRSEHELPGCCITCAVEAGSWPLEGLCGFAVRHNARRRFLFVSKVLGRHWPTPPADLRAVAEALAQKLVLASLVPPVVFIGMAETATTLGQAVFRAWRKLAHPADSAALYLDTTRRRTGGPVAFAFSEDHSHASAHLLHEPDAASDPHQVFCGARTLVIVDDEATTGRTASNLAQAFAAWQGQPEGTLNAHLAVLTRWRQEGAAAAVETMPLHTLLSGTFTFTASGDFLPAAPQQTQADGSIPAPRGSRHGVAGPEALPASVVEQAQCWAAAGSRHLVLGSGEFGFPPLLWAEALESAGAQVCLQAVTRSPILEGGVIRHVRSFPALCGAGHREFLYNVPDDHGWDAVWLCREDAVALPADHHLWLVPRLRESPPLREVEILTPAFS